MAIQNSLFKSALTLLFSGIVLIGGAAKLYRGFSVLTSTRSNSVLDELLKKSDESVAEANRQSNEIAPVFQSLLGDFDQLGVAAFRLEKREACAQLTEQFTAVNNHLHVASTSLLEATNHGTSEKVTAFLKARSNAYELLVKVNTQNIDIIEATLDESIVDTDAIVELIMSIAKSRDADQIVADEATAAADAVMEGS